MKSGLQTILSLMFLLLAFWIYRNGRGRWPLAIVLSALGIGSIFLYAFHTAANYFTAAGINEAVLFHFMYGLDGAGIREYWGIVATTAIILIAGTTIIIGLVLTKVNADTPWGRTLRDLGILSLPCALISLTFNPAITDLYNMLVAPGDRHYATINPRNASQLASEEFSGFYLYPTINKAIGPPRNMVFVYAESLERTYFDENRFPGLISGLRALEKQAISFTGLVQVPGTGWTIAGMVASQCGIPLVTPSHGNSMSGMDSFLPGARCLGDLLKENNYHLAYYGGARTRFAGKEKFLQTHGFDEILGWDQLKEFQQDRSYAGAWGLHDDTLLEFAFDKYIDLARNKRRFALFLLTLDTHHPDGHPSRQCDSLKYRDGSNPILNAVRCTDILVSRFVDRIRRSPYGHDTVIVIASDHLAMRNSASSTLEMMERKNLFMVLDQRSIRQTEVSTPGSTLDIGPTVMSLLGYQADVGLGRNLMRTDAATSIERAMIQQRLTSWRDPILDFWDFPRISDYLEIDVKNANVSIDGRIFRIPSMLNLDEELQTVVKFPYRSPPIELVRQNKDVPFLLISNCATVDSRASTENVCLFVGHGTHIHSQLVIRRTTRFSTEQLRKMIGAITG